LLEKRAGQTRLNAEAIAGAVNGGFSYYKGVTRHLIVCGGGKVYRYVPATGAMVEVKSGISSTARIQMSMTANYMVVVDGVTLPWKYDGLTITDLANAPSDAWLVELYGEKAIMVKKSDPSRLQIPKEFEPETWPGDSWPVGDGDGDEIRCIRTYHYQEHLAVFKRRSVWALRGTSMDDFSMPESKTSPGAVGPNAVVELGAYMYYVADTGIYRYDGLSSVCLTKSIETLWSRVNKAAIDNAAAGVWGDVLRFSLPLDDSATNNFELCYDPDIGAWWPNDGKALSLYLTWDDGTGTGVRFLAGSAADGYITQQDVGATDFGDPIVAVWDSPLLDLNADRMKKMLRLFIGLHPDSSVPGVRTAATVTAAVNLSTAAPLTAIVNASDPLQARYNFAAGTHCRYFQFRLTHSGTAKLLRVRYGKFQFLTKPR
jgi:hypothetical protein